VLFTVADKGGGIIQMFIVNQLPQVVNAYLSWSWGGHNGKSSIVLAAGRSGFVQVNLPDGFDAPLEIFASNQAATAP
jgi:hypothetical protein